MQSYVRVPPDGAGKKIQTVEHTLGANQVETQVQHIADAADPSRMLAIDINGSASVRFSEGQPILSGFGSLKTTHERVLGVYENSLDTYEDLFSTILVGGGASTYQPDSSSQVLSVDGTVNSASTTITNRYHYYCPGSSNVYKFSLSCGDSGKAGNRREWGVADLNDGLLFALDGTTLNVVIRSSVSGSVVETSVSQSAWNTDKLDGTGSSGFAIDVTKANVYWIDYQWLGAGRVRFGVFSPDGDRVVAHVFENAGLNPLPYMRTGTLPAYISNKNTGTTGSTSEIRIICIGVYVEGTYQDYTYWRFSDVDTSRVVTTDTLLCSIKAAATINGKHNTVVIYPETLNIFCTAPVAITLWQSATIVGTAWTPCASALEFTDYGTFTPDTNSQKFKTLYFNAGATSIDLDKFFEKNDEGIQVNADGTPEVWCFTATKLTDTATNCTMNLGYKELW